MAQITETRFTTFWRGASAALAVAGLPPINPAEAQVLWRRAYAAPEPVPVIGTRPLSLIERAARATGEIA